MISRLLATLGSRISLGMKFSMLLVVSISITSATLGYMLYSEGFTILETELRRAGVQMTSHLAERNAPYLLRGDTWELYQSVNGLLKNVSHLKDSITDMKYAAILDKNGSLAAHSNPGKFPVGLPFELKGIPISQRPDEIVEIRSDNSSRESEVYHFYAPIMMREKNIGTAVIGISEEKLVIQIESLKNKIILITLLLASVAIIVGQIISVLIIRPLTRLSGRLKNLPPKIIEGVQFDRLGVRNELQFFIEGFNTIIERYGYVVNQLSHEKEKMDGILNGMHAGMIVVNRDFRIEWQNRIHTHWFGVKVGELCRSESHSSSSMCPECPAKEVFKGDVIVSKKMKRRVLSGEEKEFNVTTAPLHDDENRINAVLELSVDITHQVYLENEIKKSEQFAMMGHMAAGLAHEIRNPLGSIVTALQILVRDKNKATKEQKEKLLKVLQDESSRLNGILTNFLNFTHTRELKMEPSDLNLIVDEIMDVLVHQKTRKPKIKIVRSLNDDLSLIQLDQNLLKQVIWNLSLNAIESMKENGGTLRVETDMENGFAELRIADTGIGMDADSLKNCFEPFYTRKKGGTGLGLAIAKRIIDQHNGVITVTSTIGKGSEFLVSIPRNI